MTRTILNILIIVFFLLQAANIFHYSWMSALENKIYDVRLNLTMPNSNDPRVVILDIDEKSLKNIGRWPWNRKVMAEIVDTLFDHYYIQVLGFDILFAEPDDSSGLSTLNAIADGPLKNNTDYLSTLEQMKEELNYDQRFANALKDRDVITGYFFRNQLNENSKNLNTGVLPPAVETTLPFTHLQDDLLTPTGFGGNMAMFQNSAWNGGFVDIPTIDKDGIVRAVPMIQMYEGEIYQSLSLALTRALLGFPPIEPVYANEVATGGDNVLEAIKFDDFEVPVTPQGIAYIPYRGKYPSYQYVSAEDVLNKSVKMETLEGAIVLMGTSATGLLDLRATPVQNVYPGVEVHANMVSGILDKTIKLKPFDVQGLDFFTHLIIGMVMIFVLRTLALVYSVFATIGLISLTIYLNYYTWQELNLITPIVSPLLMILMLFVLHIAYGYFIEDHKKRKLKGLFGQYVPPELVDEMNKNISKVSLKSETREMTVLFSDIRGFTRLSETMDPESLSELMNLYLTEMTKIIHKHRGTVDKYIGDAIMAFWGAPLSDEEHARHALLAAVEMKEQLPLLNKKFEERGYPSINIGMGLNTGRMNVGNMGSEFRIAYTVLGDSVNLASRLESITKQYGETLIISETTKLQVPEWSYQEIDLVRVVGKQVPISIYKPVAANDVISKVQQKEIDLFDQALDYYRNKNWQEAKRVLNEILKFSKSPNLYSVYMNRLEEYQNHAPENDWDGVFEAKSK